MAALKTITRLNCAAVPDRRLRPKIPKLQASPTSRGDMLAYVFFATSDEAAPEGGMAAGSSGGPK